MIGDVEGIKVPFKDADGLNNEIGKELFNIYEPGFGIKEYLATYHAKNIRGFKKDEYGLRRYRYQSITINMADLMAYERNHARTWKEQTGSDVGIINIFSKDVHENPDQIIEKIRLALADLKPEYYVDRVEIHFDNANWPIAIRDIRMDNINHMYAISCTVSKISSVRPVLVEAAWECARCKNLIYIPQVIGESVTRPAYCSCNEEKKGVFRLIDKESKYYDFQLIRLSETVDTCTDGRQPQTIDAELLNDLCGDIVPGETVIIYGIPRLVEKKDNRGYSKTNKELHIEVMGYKNQDRTEFVITPEDEAKIRSLGLLPDIKEKIVNSIAPSIYGHNDMKRSIALVLVSGGATVFKDGTRQRGSSHMLAVGDPGTAKSVILKAAQRLCVKSMYFSDKGASGVGLTAAAVPDNFGGNKWSIEAGAMPMCNGGFVFMDELDKMSEDDRKCLHGVLENQVIEVAKAGLRARLKAETSLIAAANPILGRFDGYKDVASQIDMPPSLLSRFDIIHIVRDEVNEESDAKIAEYIISAHSNNNDNPFLEPEINESTLKKYLHFARTRINPSMDNKEIKNYLKDVYVKIRKSGINLQITPRQLGGIIRLAKSSARLRLSMMIDKRDIDEAVELYLKTLEEAAKGEDGATSIDNLMSGVTKSQADRMKAIYKYVMDNDDDEDGIWKKDIVRALEILGFDDAGVYRSVNELCRKGKLTDLRNGRVLNNF